MADLTFDVMTDLEPEYLSEAAIAVFQMWVEFALGQTELNGHKIENPTGRYASSISMRAYGERRIAIISNSKIAPEADILETGHPAIDLKKRLTPGRVYPMHRGSGFTHVGGGGRAGYRGTRKMWAKARSAGAAGFATVPTHITPENADSWIIPEMPAYSPARLLATLAREHLANGGTL